MRPAMIAIATFLVVVAAVVVFFIIRISEGRAPKENSLQASAPSVTLISVSHTYKSGMHTISGSVKLPTACTPLTATSSATAEGIRVDLDSRADDGVCLQLPATTTFKVSAAGASNSAVRIYLNGTLSTTTP